MTVPNQLAEQSDDEIVASSRRQSFHPLEMFPWFRRFPCSLPRDLIYTFIWNSILGLIFSALSVMFSGNLSMKTLYFNLLISQFVGYTIHALFILGSFSVEPWVLRQKGVVIAAYYTVVASSGVLLGFLMAAYVFDWNVWRIVTKPGWLVAITLNSLLISLIIMVIYIMREKRVVAETRLAREKARFADMERNATLANLRMLQAQIEPHFLFNTLANVTSLIHPAPDKAKLMLESFIHYLRASLASSRDSHTTLGQEFALLRQLLNILKVRMGERLVVRAELPPALESVSLPPMLIQPLVENAIKHGLEPKVEGGELRLDASREGANIRIEVSDTGMGFNGANSSGMGLRNVRERLIALFGNEARLSIEDLPGGGTRAVLELPEARLATAGTPAAQPS